VAKLSTEKSRSIPAEWGKPGGPFPVSSLSDNEWISIADVTGIHLGTPEVRQAFDDAVGKYRRREVNDEDRRSAAETRDQLCELRKRSVDLKNTLAECIGDLDAYFAVSPIPLIGGGTIEGAMRDRITRRGGVAVP
jgi:hypothetical protein